ncbi:MAG: class I SAM-dependent methyltransferase [Polaribacter sp.]|nr:class I SAM-dependent methyltransferase [Polaribacter sp.]
MTFKTEGDCQSSNKINYTDHWDAAYSKTTTDSLGWYEENSTPTLQLIEACQLPKEAAILNVGSGSSTLIDDLLDLKYSNVIASDLSLQALSQLKNRLKATAENVQYIVDDLTNSTALKHLKNIDLWNDRAVLHFFLTEKERTAYFDLLKHIVKKEGFVIIATFAKEGAKKCCGLDVYRYNTAMLQESLGTDFELLETFDYTFINPNGDPRPYVYALFKRVNI